MSDFDDWGDPEDFDDKLLVETTAEEHAPAERQPGEDDEERKFLPFEFRPLSAYEPLPVEWLWHGRIPKGNVTIVEGHPGIGKSTAVIDLVARLTTSRPWPGEDEFDTVDRSQLTVLWMTLEDSPSHTLHPRLLAAEGDPSKVLVMTEVPKLGTIRSTDNVLDQGRLKQTILESGADVLILDPGSAALEDGNSEPVVRQALGVLYKLGVEHGLTSIWIRHLAKASGTDGRNPMLAGIGSIGVSAAGRSQLQLLTNEKADGEGHPLNRWLVQVKSNLGPLQAPVPYGLMHAELLKHPDIDVARVEWGEPDPDHDIYSICAANSVVRSEQKQRSGRIEKRLVEAFQRNNPLTAGAITGILRDMGIKASSGVSDWRGWQDFMADYKVTREGKGKGTLYRMANQNEEDE